MYILERKKSKYHFFADGMIVYISDPKNSSREPLNLINSFSEVAVYMWYIYTMEYYSAILNNKFMKFSDKWMDLEDIILSEVTQLQKNTHYMHSLISGY